MGSEGGEGTKGRSFRINLFFSDFQFHSASYAGPFLFLFSSENSPLSASALIRPAMPIYCSRDKRASFTVTSISGLGSPSSGDLKASPNGVESNPGDDSNNEVPLLEGSGVAIATTTQTLINLTFFLASPSTFLYPFHL